MITRGGQGHGGCGRSNARGRRHNYTGTTSTSTSKKRVVQRPDKQCVLLWTHVCSRSDAHQHGKIVQYVRTNYGQDISNELQNKATVTITYPVHTDDIIVRNALQEAMVRSGQANIQAAQETKTIFLRDTINSTPMVVADAPMKLAILENYIAEGEFERDTPVPVQMTDS